MTYPRRTRKGDNMKVLYRISKYTNENSNYKLHIPIRIDINKPLCHQSEKDNSLAGYEFIDGKPTCKKCLQVFHIETGYTYEDFEAQKQILDKIASLPLINEIKL